MNGFMRQIAAMIAIAEVANEGKIDMDDEEAWDEEVARRIPAVVRRIEENAKAMPDDDEDDDE